MTTAYLTLQPPVRVITMNMWYCKSCDFTVILMYWTLQYKHSDTDRRWTFAQFIYCTVRFRWLVYIWMCFLYFWWVSSVNIILWRTAEQVCRSFHTETTQRQQPERWASRPEDRHGGFKSLGPCSSQFSPMRRERAGKHVATLRIQYVPLVGHLWPFQKGPGVVTVTVFQATNHILDRSENVIRHPGNQVNVVCSVVWGRQLADCEKICAEPDRHCIALEWQTAPLKRNDRWTDTLGVGSSTAAHGFES